MTDNNDASLRLIHQTWCIRTISPFSMPMDPSSLGKLAKELTLSLQQQQQQDVPGMVQTKTDQDTNADNNTKSGYDGTLVVIEWIDTSTDSMVTKNGMNDDTNSTDDNGVRTKSNNSSTQNGVGRHLLFDAIVQDQSVGQVVLSFPSIRSHSGGRPGSSHGQHIQSFGLSCERGNHRIANKVVLAGLEARFGCVFGTRRFQPTPDQIGWAMQEWLMPSSTTLPQHESRNSSSSSSSSGGGGGGDGGDVSNAMTTETTTEETPQHQQQQQQQIEVTLQPPPTIKNLQNIKLTIPSASFRSLKQQIETERPKKRIRHNNNNNNTDSVGASDGASADDRNMDSADTDMAPPVATALQHFVWEAMHLNVASFALIRIRTPLAVLGCDGRFKVYHRQDWDTVLMAIQRMVNEQIGRDAVAAAVAVATTSQGGNGSSDVNVSAQ